MKNFATFCVLIAFGAMTILTTFVSGQNSTAEIASPKASSILQTPPNARYVPDEVLVQFKATSSEAERSEAKRLIGAVQEKRLETEPMRAAGAGELTLVSIGSGLTVEDAIRTLEQHPAVQFAEPNWIYNHYETSNDPFYTNGSMWGMYGDLTIFPNQFGSQAGEAWANGLIGSDSVYVGVIDEGIQFDHPDLSGNFWTNPFDPVDGIDNDGNGRVDDIRGWDFVSNDNTIYDGPQDDHGTHVAGTIGAVGGNGIGVVGVNWNVTLINGKFLGPGGGTTANAILAVDYFTDLKTRHNLNLVATNNSWGGGGFSQGLLDAIIRAANQGILFMAAAGNGGADQIGDNNDITPHYPSNYNTMAGAGYDNVISVASITSSGARSSFSNFGAISVDLGGPGSGIFSTLPTNTYGSFSGTSMATPHVTGAAALYRAANPGSSALTIRNAILSSTIATASLNGITVTGGRLNVGDFTGGGSNYTLTASPSTVDPGQTINVNWTAPAGRPPTDWIGLYRVGDPDTSFISYQYTGGAPSGSRSFTAPAQAGQYEFRYFTEDSFNKVATSNTVTVSGVPQTFSLSATPTTVDPGQTINVSWTAPAGRPPTDWIGLHRVGDPDTSFISYQYTGGAPSGTRQFTAPAQAGQYDFRYFTNDSFNKVATSNTVTVSGVPQTFSLSASPTTVNPGQTINVNWTAPAGRPPTDWIGLYRVGDPDTSYLSYQYTGGAPSGSRQFTAPAQGGQYEFRYFTNDTFNKVATSNAVTVTGG